MSQPGKSNGATARVGLALGGGAELGLAHIGVLETLERHGFVPACVAGCSAGALVAALYAAGVSVARMRGLAGKINWRSFQRRTLPVLALSTNEPLGEFLRSLLPTADFDSLRVPLRVVATDLLTAQMVVFEGGPGLRRQGIITDPDVVFATGDLVEAVRASCCRPVINRPVRIQGRWLVDGNLTHNVPATLARDMGADVVVAVDLQRVRRQGAPPRNIVAYALQAQSVFLHWCIKNRRIAADVIIRPDFSGIETAGFAAAERLIRCGEIAAEAAMGALRARCGWDGPRLGRKPTAGA